MKRISFNFLYPLIALGCLVYALSRPMFGIPPMGKLLDPFIGVVRNSEGSQSGQRGLVLDGMGVKGPVNVYFDNRDVPHIYAGNTEDLYFAQGYVTAYFRLWQMDFLSYASAGRISEIIADGFVDQDRNQRRIGILASAKASLELIRKDPETSAILAAYTKGVNAYISLLNYSKMPLEYKILDYKPEPWSDLKTVLIMKYMANTLSGYEEDVSMSHMMLALGEQNFNKLFPDFFSPVTPVDNDSFRHVNPDLVYVRKPDYLDYPFLSSGSLIPDNTYNPKLGSNSWAVSGKKTLSGSPILCSDPHLNLTLPCIWIEMQLSSPGMNVYGVSIPGTPAIIIGFNKDIAWGITNGADDVKDWYKMKISGDYKKYELDGKWLDLGYTVEEIKRRNQRSLFDTIYHSVQGPIVADKNFTGGHPELTNYALKWELHNPSNEFATFVALNRAVDYNGYKRAIANYSCPTQNFTFACKDNTIAMNHQGRMAIKKGGEGKFILDGTKSSFLHPKYIPEDSLPYSLDPASHFVLSANQHPTNATYPYYYNGYYSEARANRIKALLEKEDKFDIGKMEAMQLDNVNSFESDALPVLIALMEGVRLSGEQEKSIMALKSWNGRYDLKSEDAGFFELWWRYVKMYTWDELTQFSFYSREPDDYVLLGLIRKEPDNIYFDRQVTSERENANTIVRMSFFSAFDRYEKMKKSGSVQWGQLNKVDVNHLLNIAPFGRSGLSSAGYPQAINAMSPTWGPGWRMVVELGERPKAYGIYAGGQTGNIGERGYDEFIDDWNKGNYYTLQFFMSPKEANEQTRKNWVLK